MDRRRLIVLMSILASLALLSALAIVPGMLSGASSDPSEMGPVGERPGETRGGTQDVLEEQEVADQREEAFAEARADGTFGTQVEATTDPTSGWTGAQLLNPATNDWEPAVATDPNAPYVYLITTRYDEPKPCPGHCPSPWIALTVSSDGGRTWSNQRPLCTCRGSGAQYDPVIEVVRKTGAVYASFLNADRKGGFSTAFIKSVDHGKTWTDPVHVYGKVAWTDKDEVTTSARGRDVYVSWNGPTGGDLWVGQSHDFGETWTQTRVVQSKRYYFAYDAHVLSDGTVVFAESSLTYTGPGASAEGQVWHHAIISRDRGTTWENVIVSKVPVGESCVAAGCSTDFYLGQASIAADANDHLTFAYEGPIIDHGPQRIYVKTSTDKGRTWGAPIVLSAVGENATQPRLAARGSGDVRLWYMQTANGDDPDAWNVWYRSSLDGGATWSSPAKLDDAPAGAAGYVNANGFDEIYGDYGEIGITSRGKTFAAWGEGFSWTGPGGTWFDLQR